MNKNTICTLLLAGAVSLLDCYSPAETEAKNRTLSIPAECKEIVSLMDESYTGWNLTCKNNDGGEVYYQRNGHNSEWKEYKIVRK